MRFFDGYQPGTRVIIFDDLCPVGHSLGVANLLKQLCHKHPAQADVKGSRIHLQHDFCVITSNYTPVDCFGSRDQVLLQALRVRFPKIILFTKSLDQYNQREIDWDELNGFSQNYLID